MILNKAELELLVKTVQPLTRSEAYSRLYVGTDSEGEFILCMDGTSLAFIGSGPTRIPDFQAGRIFSVDLNIKELLKDAREATKPAKYDAKFELEVHIRPEIVLLNFRFNGGDHIVTAPPVMMQDLLGMHEVRGLKPESVIIHEFSPTGLCLMTQCAELSKNQPLRLYSARSSSVRWGVCLADSPNGFGGVATVEM